MTTYATTTADQILRAMGISASIETSPEDGSRALNRSLPRDQARDLVARLRAAGVEADAAPDHDDRTRAWVYVTEGRVDTEGYR